MTPSPDPVEIAGKLTAERSAAYERLGRCNDLFGKMLITGKIHALTRQIEALEASRAHLTGKR